MRRAIIICIVFLLTGCPAYFSAAVRNQSDFDLQFLRLNQKPDIVSGNETKSVSWYRGCQTVIFKGTERHLVIDSVPDGTYKNIGNRETRFNVVFDGDKFHLENGKGELFKIVEQASCKNT